MTAMFDHCESLKELDLSNFGLSNVNYISYMFGECKSLKTINLSNFRCPNVYYINYLFGGCDSLETVYASDDNIKKIFYDFKGKLNENTFDFDIIDYGDDDVIDNQEINNIISEMTEEKIEYIIEFTK
jgi:surface protein